MLFFLKVLLIIVAIALIAGVLLQSGKGGGLAGMDGGVSSLLGAQSKALDSIMSKVTTVAAILFMALSLLIAVLQ